MTLRLGILGLLSAVLAACGVYALKYEVQHLEGELQGLRRAVATEQNALVRLRAEWAALNQPARLARLAAEHLGTEPARPGQIAAIEDIPLRVDLELADLRLPARLPSGGEVALRLKPHQLALRNHPAFGRAAERGRGSTP
jgi:hypothetical protein